MLNVWTARQFAPGATSIVVEVQWTPQSVANDRRRMDSEMTHVPLPILTVPPRGWPATV